MAIRKMFNDLQQREHNQKWHAVLFPPHPPSIFVRCSFIVHQKSHFEGGEMLLVAFNLRVQNIK